MLSDLFDHHLKLSFLLTITAIICVDVVLVTLLQESRGVYQEYVRPARTPDKTLGVQAQEERLGLPVKLTIPGIRVEADIEPVGVTEAGAMVAPSSSRIAGWFSLGPRPGDLGSAVIAGHFNSEESDKGVFLNLSEMRRGDRVFVENDEGKTFTFVVREVHTYDPGYVDDVFGGKGSHLNLVTCDGEWDPLEKIFSKRLVVFTDLVI